MADDLPVTVNIVGNLAPLEQSLRKGAEMAAQFEQTLAVKDVQVRATKVTVERVESENKTTDITAGMKSSPAPSSGKQMEELRLLQAELDTIDAKLKAVRDNNEEPLPGWVEARREVVETIEAIHQAQAKAATAPVMAGVDITAPIKPKQAQAQDALAAALPGFDLGTLEGKTDDEIVSVLKEIVKAQTLAVTGDEGFSIEVADTIDGFSEQLVAELREAMASAATINSARPEPKILDFANQNKRDPDAPIELPAYANAELQAQRLIELTRKWVAERRQIRDAAGPDDEEPTRYRKLGVAIAEAKAQLEALQSAGVKVGNEGPAQNAQSASEIVGIDMPNIVGAPEDQYQALTRYDAALSQAMERLKSAGQGGGVAFSTLEMELLTVRDELERMEAEFRKIEEKRIKKDSGKTQTSPGDAAPPPSPDEPPDFLETINQVVQLTEATGVSTGAVGTLARSTQGLTVSFSALTTALSGSLLVLAGLVVAVAAAVTAIAALVTVVVSAGNAAEHAAQKYIKLSGALGSIDGAKIAVKEIRLATEGTGIDSDDLIHLYDNLSRRARDYFLQGPGLQLVVKASARLDPAKAGEFGEVLGSAMDSFRTGGTDSMVGSIESINRMGLVSNDAAKRLEYMARQGVSNKTVWAEMMAAIDANASSTEKANQTLGGLMRTLNQDISTTWTQMLEVMGAEIVKSLGPGFESMTGLVERIKPKLMEIAAWLGQVIGSVGKWVSSAIDGAITGMATLRNMFVSGDLGEFVKLSFINALMVAANEFINAVVVGAQFLGDLLVGSFMMLGDGDFWSGIGNYLIAAAYGFLAVFAGLGSMIFNAISPVLDLINAVFTYAGAKLSGGIKMALAAAMPDGDEKDALWNQGKKDVGMTWEQAREETRGTGTYHGDAAEKAAGEARAESRRLTEEGNESLGKAKDKAFKEFAPEEYTKPDIFKDDIDKAGSDIAAIIERNLPPPKDNSNVPEPKIKLPELSDVFAQGGPRSVADSLQQVGGGGNAAGISIDERILAENKEQTSELRKISGKDQKDKDPNKLMDKTKAHGTLSEDGKYFTNENRHATDAKLGEKVPIAQTPTTPNISPAYGGRGADGEADSTTVLISIHSTLVSILNAIISGGGGAPKASGSLVTTRG
jgi:hypothetical protein